uniref:Uncharacterized protein n=1 Tax=Manihot esculenta TaxID=3983 RepID=A0A2C9WFS7_MANES
MNGLQCYKVDENCFSRTVILISGYKGARRKRREFLSWNLKNSLKWYCVIN